MKLLRYLLLPIALIYGGVTIIRNWLFDQNILKPSEFNIPIINVGNLSMGGTGKTPHVEYIIKLISNQHPIAVLSRGYGRKTSDYIEAEIDHKSYEVGDEPLQFKTKFPAVTIVVEKNRVKGILNLLYDHPNKEAIILDDAFQHRAIKSGLNILLTTYSKPFFDDEILPIGTLREFKKGYRRADLIIVTKCPEKLSEKSKNIFHNKIPSNIPLFFSRINYGKIYSLNNQSILDINQELNILLITGIADATDLINELNKRKLNFKHLAYRDHYPYKEKDAKHISEIFDTFAGENKVILTTEKDSMRMKTIKAFKELPIYVFEIEVEFLEEKTSFDNQIIEYVRFDKKDS